MQPLAPSQPMGAPPTPENARDAQQSLWFLAARFLKWLVLLLFSIVAGAVAIAVYASW